ncbi:DNA cytosine methyltransferase [Candidatus Gracilibacteria bacterium]|nr:DNA cytosine methyltransferase [Candidatus Gracilibacteria bacterium]
MTKKSENEVEESAYYHKEEPIIKKGKISGKKPIVFEAFCGCGGTSLGFEMAGYEIGLGIDILKPAIDTFKKNHPNSYSILGDIRKVNSLDIKKITGVKNIDVLIGGVPCQGFSLNNKKRNELDKRNFLYLEFVKLIKQLSPKIVVLENVSGMKSTANGKFVDDISKSIESIGNYKVVHKMLYAPDYGVPQKRNRLIFIGVDKELGEEFNFDDIIKTHGPGTDKEYVNIKNAIGDLPELEPGTEKMKYNKEAFSDYQKTMRNNGNILLNHKAPNHPQDTIDKIKNTIPGEPIYEKYKQRIRLSWDILSPTQVSGGIRPQFQFGHPSDNRGLTIRERCRLQSFPDNFEVMGGIVQGRVQTGNAVPPLLAKAVAKALFKYFK